MLQQGDARGNKQPAQHYRPDHAPQQRLVLAPGTDAEALKQNHENKQVVDA
jgi:hypothetical protein